MEKKLISNEDALLMFLDQSLDSCRVYERLGNQFRYSEESTSHPAFCGMLAMCAALVRRSGVNSSSPCADGTVVMAMLLLTHCGIKIEDVVDGDFGRTWLEDVDVVSVAHIPDEEKPS